MGYVHINNKIIKLYKFQMKIKKRMHTADNSIVFVTCFCDG